MRTPALALALLLCGCPAEPGPQCSDGRVNGTETDVDCGGDCPACGVDRLCLIDGDCASRVCALNRCQAPTCTDGVQNGAETGVDCGGACAACGGGCVRNSDCPAGVCFDGMCGPGPCAAPLATCNAACVDPRVDRAHCGGCNQPCPGDLACVGGTCLAMCIGGTRACGPACVDVGSDPLNCGMCNRACAPKDVCVAGDCFPRCGPNQVDCQGACVSIDRDPNHCGLCGKACPPGSGCLAGACTAGCTLPLAACDAGQCIDPRFDPMHCGGCNQACPPVPHAKPACTPAGCTRSACDPGFADCDAGTADGCEAELGVDSQNCGACGRACFGSDACVMGRCCGPLPPGSYQSTCTNCEACNGILSCLCNDAAQNPKPASIPLGPCGPPGGFTNCNGVLLCNGC